MGKTTNLGLHTTATNETSKTFLEYRTELSGTGADSNMNIIDKAYGDMDDKIDAVNDTLDAKIDANKQAETDKFSTLDGTVSGIQSSLSQEVTARTSGDQLLQSQIDQIVAPSGTIDGASAAEVENARVGVDATTYASLGEAIRGQVGNLKSDLNGWLAGSVVKRPTFSKGGVNRADGDVNTYANRLNSSLIRVKPGDVITTTWSLYYSVSRYSVNASTLTYLGNSYDDLGGWIQQKNYAIEFDGFVIITLSKTQSGTSNFTAEEVAAIDGTFAIHSGTSDCVDGVFLEPGSTTSENTPSMFWYLGDDYAYKGFSNNKLWMNFCRWRTTGWIDFEAGATVSIKDGFRFYIFTDINGTRGTLGWHTGTYTFSEKIKARFDIAFVDETTHTYYPNWPEMKSIIAINNSYKSIAEEYGKSENDELLVGELVNGHLLASGVNTNDSYYNYRVSTRQVVAFPSGSYKQLHVAINPKYVVALRYGVTSTNLSISTEFLTSGAVIDLDFGANYYAVTIANADDTVGQIHDYKTTPVTPDENFGLSITFEKGQDIITENDDAEKILSSAKLYFTSSGLNTLNRYAVLGHTSDCHGDYQRVKNFLRFCDNAGVDMACITGDIVAYNPNHGIKWFSDMLNSHTVLPGICTGNHDVYDNDSSDSDVYDFMFAPIADRIGNTTGKTWYYKDIASKKLRVISVNLYQYGGTSRWYTHFTDEQLSWLATTLQSTPSGYGIVVLSHAPQTSMVGAEDPEYDAFFQRVRKTDNIHNAVDGTPIYDIVDAFIARSVLTRTYAQTGSPSSVTVSADFTGVASDVEFVAHVTGHLHQDTICYVPGTTQKQLMLNVTCTNALYGGTEYPYLADLQDQGRFILDASQDAFNIYVIDRDTKSVKVVRVGSDRTHQMTERKYMVIPYA